MSFLNQVWEIRLEKKLLNPRIAWNLSICPKSEATFRKPTIWPKPLKIMMILIMLGLLKLIQLLEKRKLETWKAETLTLLLFKTKQTVFSVRRNYLPTHLEFKNSGKSKDPQWCQRQLILGKNTVKVLEIWENLLNRSQSA